MSPLNLEALCNLDDSIPGPSINRLADAVRERLEFSDGFDRLSVDDRDVFRPLQYCAMAFKAQDLEWRTRDVVENGGLHLEALVKRVGGISRVPLGAAVRQLRGKLGPFEPQLQSYADLHNDAKHEYAHEFGTHMFSVSDAVFAYIISRVIGVFLYPRASLKSDLRFVANSETRP
jgi:hypothetical protein